MKISVDQGISVCTCLGKIQENPQNAHSH